MKVTMSEVFISFETGTALDLAEHVKRILEFNKISSFMYRGDILTGDENGQKIINDAIKECKYFIVLITSYNLGKVKEEIKLARQLKKTLMAYKLKKLSVKRRELTKIIPELNDSPWIGDDFETKDELIRNIICDLGKRDPNMLERMLEKKELSGTRPLSEDEYGESDIL